MITTILAIVIVAFFFIALSIRMILLKNGEFKGTCASQNRVMNPEGEACDYCGKVVMPGGECKKSK